MGPATPQKSKPAPVVEAIAALFAPPIGCLDDPAAARRQADGKRA
jgi:hypothetical protein